jgi:hypothetical protein
MAAYHTLDNHKDYKKKNSDEKKDGTQRNPLMTAYLIKNIVKLYKIHKIAADCREMVSFCEIVDNWEDKRPGRATQRQPLLALVGYCVVCCPSPKSCHRLVQIL